MSKKKEDAERRARLAAKRAAKDGGMGAATTGKVGRPTTGVPSGMGPGSGPDIRRAHQSKSGGFMGFVLLAAAIGVGYYAFTREQAAPEARRIFEARDFDGIIDLGDLQTDGDTVVAYMGFGGEARAGTACRTPFARMVQEIATEGYSAVVLHDGQGNLVCSWNDSQPLPQP